MSPWDTAPSAVSVQKELEEVLELAGQGLNKTMSRATDSKDMVVEELDRV